MKKTFKRLGAMFLAMVMAVSVLCTGALATNTAQKGPFTITVKNETSGYTYQAYQVFKGDLATDSSNNKILSNIQWGTDVDTTKTDNEKTLLQAIQAIDTGSDAASNKPFEKCTDAAGVAAVLSDSDKATADVVKEFAKVVGKYLGTTSKNESQYKTANADGDTHASNDKAHYDISVNDAGYYLVKNTGVPSDTTNTETAYTNYILEVVGNVQVDPKTSVPTVDKTVQNPQNKKTDDDKTAEDYSGATTAQIGESVNFKLTGTLPSNYEDYEKYQYTFNDTLSKGLTLPVNANKVTGLTVTVYPSKDQMSAEDGKLLKEVSTNTDTSGYYVTHTANSANSTTSLTVAFANLKDVKADSNNNTVTITKDSVIVVSYSATLNENAVIGKPTDGDNNAVGNFNRVHLVYSNDPNATGDGTTGKTPEDEVQVYTFKLNITKTDTTGKEKLKDAKFVLSTKENATLGDIDDSGVPATTTDLIAVKGNTPNYTVNDAPGTEATKNTYVMSTDDSGALNISGLKPGKYYLYETKAPDGYNRRTTAIPIEIKATVSKDANKKTFSVTDLKINADEEKEQGSENLKWTDGVIATGTVSATITNSAGSNLPSTGGMGTKLFYTVGGLLMAGAAIVLVIKKRRSSAE